MRLQERVGVVHEQQAFLLVLVLNLVMNMVLVSGSVIIKTNKTFENFKKYVFDYLCVTF